MSCIPVAYTLRTRDLNSVLQILPNTYLTFRQAMIDEFDLDQDGEISEAEFVSLVPDRGYSLILTCSPSDCYNDR